MKHLYLLFSLFVFFSCKHNKGSNESKIDFCTSIHRNDSITLSKTFAPIADKLKSQTGAYVLEDGGGAMIARAWFSEYAEKSIDIQYFIFSTDNVGLIACDYLVRAADRGVKVRIIVDDIMVEATPEEVLMLDSHPNIEIKIYNIGTNLGKNLVTKLGKFATDFRDANQRMHNKTFIVDGKVGITGGRNIADEYFDYDHEYNFRDRDVLLLGKEVGVMHNSFEQFWNHSLSTPISKLVKGDKHALRNPKRFDALHQYACNPANFWPQVREKIQKMPQTFQQILHSDKLYWLDSVNFVSDIPGKNNAKNSLKGGGITTDTLINLVKNARKSIVIQSPYLITTKLGKSVFKEAIDRGVKVKILTNSLASTDNLEAFSGYQRDRDELLEIGVEIFEFKPDAESRFKVMTGDLQDSLQHKPIFGLHAKCMVVDEKITVIGTFNLDPRSANLNTECVTVIHSSALSKQTLANMNEDFKPENAWQTTKNFNPDNEASKYKQLKTWTRKAIPKSIL